MADGSNEPPKLEASKNTCFVCDLSTTSGSIASRATASCDDCQRTSHAQCHNTVLKLLERNDDLGLSRCSTCTIPLNNVFIAELSKSRRLGSDVPMDIQTQPTSKVVRSDDATKVDEVPDTTKLEILATVAVVEQLANDLARLFRPRPVADGAIVSTAAAFKTLQSLTKFKELRSLAREPGIDHVIVMKLKSHMPHLSSLFDERKFWQSLTESEQHP